MHHKTKMQNCLQNRIWVTLMPPKRHTLHLHLSWLQPHPPCHTFQPQLPSLSMHGLGTPPPCTPGNRGNTSLCLQNQTWQTFPTCHQQPDRTSHLPCSANHRCLCTRLWIGKNWLPLTQSQGCNGTLPPTIRCYHHTTTQPMDKPSLPHVLAWINWSLHIGNSNCHGNWHPLQKPWSITHPHELWTPELTAWPEIPLLPGSKKTHGLPTCILHAYMEYHAFGTTAGSNQSLTDPKSGNTSTNLLFCLQATCSTNNVWPVLAT